MFCLILLVLLLTRRRWGYCGYYHPYSYGYPPYPYPYAYGAYSPYDPYWRARYYGYGYGYRYCCPRWWW